MLPDRVSNPGPLTYKSGALPVALRGPALKMLLQDNFFFFSSRHIFRKDFIAKECKQEIINVVSPRRKMTEKYEGGCIHTH